jgi:hypothetical protein
MKVTEVVDITEISSSKTEHIYTATPTRILKLVQIDKGQKTRFMLFSLVQTVTSWNHSLTGLFMSLTSSSWKFD